MARNTAFLSRKDALFARFPLSLCVGALFAASMVVKSETPVGVLQSQQSPMLLQACMILLIISISSLAKFHTSSLDDLPVATQANLDQPIVLRILEMRHAFLTEVKYGLISVLAVFVVITLFVVLGLVELDLNLCIVAHAFASSLVMETFARLILLPMCKMQSFDDSTFVKSRTVSVTPFPSSSAALEPAAWVYVRASCFSLHHFTCLWLAVCGIIARMFGPKVATLCLLGLLLHLPAAVLEVLGYVTGDELHVSSFLQVAHTELPSHTLHDARFQQSWWTRLVAIQRSIRRTSAIWRYVVPVLPEAQQKAFWRHQRGGGTLFKGLFVVAVLPTVLLCLLWVATVVSAGTWPDASATTAITNMSNNSLTPLILFTTSQAAVLLLLSTLGTIMDAVFFEAALEFTAREQSNSTALLRWLSHECRSPVAAALLATDEVLAQMLPRMQSHIQKALHLAAAVSISSSHPPNPVRGVLLPAPREPGSGGAVVHSAPEIPLKSGIDLRRRSSRGLAPDVAKFTDSVEGSASVARPRRGSCMSMGSLLSMEDVEKHFARAEPAAPSVTTSPAAHTKPHLIKTLESSYHELRSMGDAVRMVQRPVDALSGVLDNMLLYLRNQRFSHKRKVSLINPFVCFQLGSAWETAFQNAQASSDTVASSTKRFRFFVQTEETPPGHNPAPAQVLSITEAVSRLELVTCSSSFTQSTMVQVLTNFMTNALKYGGCKDSSQDVIEVHARLLKSGCVVSGDGIAGGGERAMRTAKRWMSEHLAGRGFAPGATQEAPGQTCEPGVVHVSVHDNGMGMSAAEVSTLFQPFSRLRSGVTQKGTGLGLWLMRQLVESQGGSVSASSAGKGMGSQFHMYAPVLFWSSLRRVDSGRRLHLQQVASQSEAAVLVDTFPALAQPLRQSHTYGTVSVAIHPLQGAQQEAAVGRLSLHAPETWQRSTTPPEDRHGAQQMGQYLHQNTIQYDTENPADWDSKAADPLEAISAASNDIEALEHRPPTAGQANGHAPVVATLLSSGSDAAAQPWSILLVDDAASIRTMLQRQLKRLGHAVTVAANGQAGLESFQQSLQQTQDTQEGGQSAPFDVVVTDITMPLLNGDEMVQRMLHLLRDEYSNVTPPVFIGATGNAMPQDIQQYLEAGIQEVLLKPYTASDIMSSIAKLMGSAVHMC